LARKVCRHLRPASSFRNIEVLYPLQNINTLLLLLGQVQILLLNILINTLAQVLPPSVDFGTTAYHAIVDSRATEQDYNVIGTRPCAARTGQKQRY